MEKILKGKKFFALAKGLAGFASILFVMLVVFSCNNLLVRNGGSLIIAMPGARSASASSYTIEIQGSNGTSQIKTVAGGSSVQFDDLAPDTYSISVEGKDESGVVVFYGTSSATVTAGKTATVTMDLQKMILGNLTVNFSETSGSTATNFTVTLTDSKNTTQSKTVAGGSSVQFDNLLVGSYTVIVDGKDKNDKIVMGGSSKATVVESQTASVMVELIEGVGDFTGLKDAVATGGRVKVLKSIDIEESLQISNAVTILPAYQDVTLKNLTSGYLISVSTGGALTVGGGEYTITLDGNDNSSFVISTGEGCSVHLNENSIITKGSRGVSLGGGTSESSLSLAGGVITGNKSNGVYLGRKSQFDMSSGSITGSSTGVFVSAESQFSMTGGSISDNTVGGVLVSGEFTMENGSITGNSSQGVSISNGGAFIMEDGSISDNGTYGVFVSGEFTMTGGSISGNTTGGVGISKDATFTMENGSITGNSARGVSITNGGAFTMEDGSISDNTGDGVFVSGEFTMTGGSISGNTTGGVYISKDATFTMEGGSIEKNNRSGSGGGVYVNTGATFTMSGSAVVNENNDVFLSKDTTISVSGNLSGGDIVAKITPYKYEVGLSLLSNAPMSSSIHEKFTVTSDSIGQKYQIVSGGTLGQLM